LYVETKPGTKFPKFVLGIAVRAATKDPIVTMFGWIGNPLDTVTHVMGVDDTAI
jgi:hypothetical protein